ncbi:unnamed protein product [Effrenium voratum]|uniref:Uncharacterized protein n=1 Tax=Effrenium voratum TaxID=2562239 RepID=A0AA36N7X7_9DINO|nr:unnamed protein product [Effrenium voratum]CAJ1402305.1 unnamed protein product [Effrenium voratum]
MDTEVADDKPSAGTVTVVVENSISGEVIATWSEVPQDEHLEALQRLLPTDLHSRFKFASESVSLLDLQATEGVIRLHACRVRAPLLFSEVSESVTLSGDADDPSQMGATIASRDGDHTGGMAMTEALRWADGVASFEVVIMEMEKFGSEGIEIGITNCSRADGFSLHQKYAVLSQPSWVSSDAGNLWISGSKQYGAAFPPWKDVTPRRLQADDVVRLAFYAETGDMEIYVNEVRQARWSGEKMPKSKTLVVSEGQQLYGLVGLRRPLKVARVRLPR